MAYVSYVYLKGFRVHVVLLLLPRPFSAFFGVIGHVCGSEVSRALKCTTEDISVL